MRTKTFRHFLVESRKIRDFSSVQIKLPERLANEIISWGAPIQWSMLPDEKNVKKYILV